MGERLGSLGEVRPSENQNKPKDQEIAEQLDHSQPVDFDKLVESVAGGETHKAEQPLRLNKYGELAEDPDDVG
ncbi:MAG: hypothetical protein ABSH44_09865 [Bryobacteraceae bacterium]|jgi:hypothetical protein